MGRGELEVVFGDAEVDPSVKFLANTPSLGSSDGLDGGAEEAFGKE